MKKITFILIFFLICIMLYPKQSNSKMVMSDINNNSNHYELIFNNENLNIGNFKLKLGLFTSYEYNITKVYIKYNDNVKEYFTNKEYFSFDSSNFNRGIEKLKNEYNLVLKQNYLYNELDKNINEIIFVELSLGPNLKLKSCKC